MADTPTTAEGFEEPLDRQGAFPRLSDDVLAALEAQGRRRATVEGELLFREGDEVGDRTPRWSTQAGR